MNDTVETAGRNGLEMLSKIGVSYKCPINTGFREVMPLRVV
jgi:hypothetical protein